MNVLIQELVSQSSNEVWGTNPFNGSPEFEGYEINPENLVKLVVYECIKIINDYNQEQTNNEKCKDIINEIHKKLLTL